MSSNTGTSKFPSIVLPTIALASTACALLVQNHHRVGHVPAIFKRIFGRFGEKKTKKTKEKETPFDENETIKTPSSNDEKDDDAKAANKSSSSKEVKEKVIKEEEIGFLSPQEKMEQKMERNEERVRRANEKGFEMITIRASSREDAKKRERAKTTTKELLFGKKRMKMKKGASDESEEEEEEEEEEEDVRIEVDISTFGAAIVALRVPSKESEDVEDVVLGFNSVEEYAKVDDHPYFGVVVGRVANRIKDGKYTLDGVEYKCDRNDGEKHTLHGGFEGLDVKRWTLKDVSESHVELSVLSGDLEQKGFPGKL
ncbi:unnamed protein product [Bathycoccus prasinos]